jgi:hypothetical protein
MQCALCGLSQRGHGLQPVPIASTVRLAKLQLQAHTIFAGLSLALHCVTTCWSSITCRLTPLTALHRSPTLQ